MRRPLPETSKIKTSSRWRRHLPGLAGAALALAASLPAQASSAHGGAMADTIAEVLSWVIICVIPIAGLAAFWMVHVMPEKIAHKKNHPQTGAIQTLCLLSLVFGGLLWPLAWLWAYTKPTNYRLAYGTDKDEHYHLDLARRLKDGGLSTEEREHLRAELDSMQSKGALSPALISARAQLHAGSIAPAAQVGGAA